MRVRVPNKYELEIDLPALEAYDIIRPETVDLIVPEAAVLTRVSPILNEPWTILPSVGVPSIRLSEDADSDLLVSLDEGALGANGTTLYFHILSDGFVPSVGDDSIETVKLIDSIFSQQSENGGWNAIIRKRLTHQDVHRINADGTLIALTVPPYDDYDVLGPETLSIILPANVLLSGQQIMLKQTIEVLATSGSATTSGTLALQGGGHNPLQPCCNREDFLQQGGDYILQSGAQPTLTISLLRDHFEPGIEYWGSPALAALIDGIQSSGNELYGWNHCTARARRRFVTLQLGQGVSRHATSRCRRFRRIASKRPRRLL